MRTPFDQLAKQIGRAALGASGTTVVHHEISPEAQHADLFHEPDSARKAERRRLGLLGRISAVPCLIEIYGHAPGAGEFRACLAKHLGFWRHRVRKARADNQERRRQRRSRKAFVEPSLWIIAAGAPRTLLTELALEPAPAPSWPAGVYFLGGDVLRVGLVVASELPRDRSTLLVRLMAAGPLLQPAIEDLRRLPGNAHERVVAERVLLELQHALRNSPVQTPEEKELIVTIYRSFEDIENAGRAKGRAEGLAEGLVKGLVKAHASTLLTVLRARGISVPVAARRRILAQKDPARLKRWLEKAIVAASIRDVIRAPRRGRSARARR